ncbi:MAG: LysM peptidoglycan-binding domain-containing protein, partial [Anaerolineae bacterium]
LTAVVLATSLALALTPLAAAADEPQERKHVVSWGETLSSIALLYDVSVEELLRVNGLANAHLIQVGQILVIPPSVTPTPDTPPSPPAGGGRTHVVTYGESLFSIALLYGVDLYELAAANGIANPNVIQPGQTLTIPNGQEPVAPAPSGAREHVVRPGETLLWIALQYGVSVDSLSQANGIANPSLIYPGQKLVVPESNGNGNPVTSPPTPAPTAEPVVVAPNATPGACVHLIHQDTDAVLGAVQDLGFGWVKQQVEWKIMEPEKGNIRWDLLDPVVEAAASRGLNLLLSVVKAPIWARPADSDFTVDGPPANPADYGDFIAAVASRYKGHVAAYEIWNEQNLWYEWGGKGHLSAGQYVELLRVAYQRIKEVDPAAIVVSGGLTPTGVNDGYLAFDDVHYLGQMYAAGAAAYFDVLGAHPSGYNNPPDDTPSFNTTETTEFKGHWSFYYRRFEQLRDVMALNGDGHKQIWFTEFGWSSQKEPPAGYEYAADNTAPSRSPDRRAMSG